MGGFNVYFVVFYGKGVRGVEGFLLVVCSSFKSFFDGISGVGDYLVLDFLEERLRFFVVCFSVSL